MSVLRSLKGTILNVQQDITSGLRSLRSPEAKEKSFPGVNSNVVQHAGSDLLKRYQDYWSEIHQLSEDNGNAAQDVDSHVNDIYLHLEQQNEAMNKFLSEASHIPALLTEITDVMSKIGNIEMLFSDISVRLSELEDVCDRQELSRNITHHQHQLALYQQKKQLELEQVKVSSALQHAHKVEDYESKLQGLIREKQEGLEAAYKTEIEKYKTSGHTQFKPSPKHTHPTADLADIDIETSSADLDAFLSEDSTTEAGQSTSPAASADAASTDAASADAASTAVPGDHDTEAAAEAGMAEASSDEEASAGPVVTVSEDSPDEHTPIP